MGLVVFSPLHSNLLQVCLLKELFGGHSFTLFKEKFQKKLSEKRITESPKQKLDPPLHYYFPKRLNA